MDMKDGHFLAVVMMMRKRMVRAVREITCLLNGEAEHESCDDGDETNTPATPSKATQAPSSQQEWKDPDIPVKKRPLHLHTVLQ